MDEYRRGRRGYDDDYMRTATVLYAIGVTGMVPIPAQRTRGSRSLPD